MKRKKNQKVQIFEGMEHFMIQVQGVQEDQSIFTKSKMKSQENRLVQVLKKSKKFTKLFAAFLEEQLKKIQADQAVAIEDIQNKSLQNTQKIKKRFKFPKLQYQIRGQPNTQVKISQLSKLNKFKPFILNKEDQYDQKIKVQPIDKIISKRIGTTNKYHMKQCLLEKRLLYYSDQTNNGKLNKSDMKSIQIMISPLDTKQVVKQEGSFFQKKQDTVLAVFLKGKSKQLVFQLKLAEGEQLRQQIIKINLRRLHRMSGIIGGQNNKNMQKFIQEKHPILDFSQAYIRGQQQYPQKQYRSTFINMIINTFPIRKSTNTLNFSKCRLRINQLNLIIKQCDKYFQHITSINFSGTKLDKQNLKNILNLIKKCPQNSKVTLNLSNCGLDDDVIQANISNFSTFCPKIQVLQLSQNQITAKSIINLRNILSSKISSIKTLNISKCPIQQFTQLSNLIKTSNNLQNIIATECKFNLNNHKQFEDLLISTQQKQQLKSINLMKNIYTGTIRWFEQISPYLQLSIDLPNKSNNSTNKTSLQSKYLRVQFKKK